MDQIPTDKAEEPLSEEQMQRRREAVERLRALSRPFPVGFQFDRDEANER